MESETILHALRDCATAKAIWRLLEFLGIEVKFFSTKINSRECLLRSLLKFSLTTMVLIESYFCLTSLGYLERQNNQLFHDLWKDMSSTVS